MEWRRGSALVLGLLVAAPAGAAMVDTGQSACYDDYREIRCPAPGRPFFGQDAQYRSAPPAYRDNGDGTVSDLVTGLTWSKAVHPVKVTPEQAATIAGGLTLGGHTDWRVPTVKELYSLIDFRGYTGFQRPSFGGRGGPMGGRGQGGGGQGGFTDLPDNAIPFIDTDSFDFKWGDTSQERYIDAQWVTSTIYGSVTMQVMRTMFGVNFADGRIKGYGYTPARGGPILKTFYARYVRGPAYGVNAFRDNGDGTVTDGATGLVWQQDDSGEGMTWEAALRHCESLTLAGRDDWRLPNAKELQFIVDYTRSPDITGSAAIDPVFHSTPIANEAGGRDFAFYWTSTTHLDGPDPGRMAAYVSFGRAIGQMRGTVMDVHGAGAQRSDPKTGRAVLGQGPQGDARRVDNFVRCVRGGGVTLAEAPEAPGNRYPDNVRAAAFRPEPGAGGTIPGPGRPGMGGQTMGAPGGTPRGARGSGGDFGKRFVSRLDTDGDGKVSRAEFDGPPQMFDRHDSDKDGYLSASEAPPPPPGFGR